MIVFLYINASPLELEKLPVMSSSLSSLGSGHDSWRGSCRFSPKIAGIDGGFIDDLWASMVIHRLLIQTHMKNRGFRLILINLV